MTTHVEAPQVAISKPRPDNGAPNSPRANDELKALPMPQLLAKLGSSADGLTQAEAQARLTRDGPNEIEEKKKNPILKFLTYFWGPIPWMIEAAVVLSARRPALARLRHHPPLARLERRGRILGGASSGQRDRCAEGQAGRQRSSEARREVGDPACARARAR